MTGKYWANTWCCARASTPLFNKCARSQAVSIQNGDGIKALSSSRSCVLKILSITSMLPFCFNQNLLFLPGSILNYHTDHRGAIELACLWGHQLELTCATVMLIHILFYCRLLRKKQVSWKKCDWKNQPKSHRLMKRFEKDKVF